MARRSSPTLDRTMAARVYVDFNEMPSSDEVLLAQEDRKLGADGVLVHLYEGLELGV